ncbi:MAG: peptide ABC transporter substrate-binding protein [Parachlamydiaceae bacterium]|nr:peptide ABC transporter substrate-binding protein [Parachlamydiaceae bacterium]
MMIDLSPQLPHSKESSPHALPLSFHPSFYAVHDKLKKWFVRFPFSVDESAFSDLALLYLLASKKYLDHRNAGHLFRLVLSLHRIQKKLVRSATFAPQVRHLAIRWIPTNLLFPFANKPVLGCLIGFNLMNRYEVFDEDNVVLALQKYLPQLRLVKESSYYHTSQHKNLKIFYFEIEKRNGASFSLEEQNLLKRRLEAKVKKSIQPLSPTIFMGLNDEEIYKNILVLSQEIQSLQDAPQAYITLDQQTRNEIIFRINLVHISPFHRFSLKERFFDSTFFLERVLTVRHIENHPIQAHIFRLHLPRKASLLRSDGSLDFYSARQKVVALMTNAIGDFRDYNGGIIIKQQELLQDFKERFLDLSTRDPELLETFFYAITPLEKQVVLPLDTMATLFTHYLENRKDVVQDGLLYSFKRYQDEQWIYLVVHGTDPSLIQTVTGVLQEQNHAAVDVAYNFIDTTSDGVLFNCILNQSDPEVESLIQGLQEALHKWHLKMKSRQVLRIGLEYSLVSLDPRIGGETVSGNVLRLLFEGLTRFNPNGNVENGMAESIEISSNSRLYTFKLRHALWNNGSPVTAYDFEYAWKKILSPDFKTSFAYLFYPIKNAKEAKEGKVSSDEIGIRVLDDRTFVVELVRPAPYFLQSIADPIFSPIHRFIDQQHPQWPYQSENGYPCNGPFQLKVNQPNQGYQLIKNPCYWDTRHIALDQIILPLVNPAQAIQAFHKNEIDWLGSPFGGWHSIFTPGKDDRIVSFPHSLVCWCVFNTRNALFKHQKLRQAFAHAIERSQITANAYVPLTPAFSPLLPYYRDNHHSLFPSCNPDKARQLFEEALSEMNLTVAEIPKISLIFHESGIREHTAVCLRQQFKECFGIDCELKPLPWNAVFQKLTSGDFTMGLMHWTSLVDDPIYATLNAFKSAAQEVNFAKWENPHFQKLLETSEQEANPFQRSSYLLQAEEILSNEMPIIPLFYQAYQALIKKDIHVVFRKPCGPFNIANSFRKGDSI